MRLTRWGIHAEILTRALWPLWSVMMAAAGLLMLGVQDMVSVEWFWGLCCIAIAGLGYSLWHALRHIRRQSREEAIIRVDETLPGRPLQTLMDEQAIGQGDAASVALWRAHRDRMTARAASARAVGPDLRVASRDPFALRYVALLVLAVALLFGSFWRVGSVAQMTPGGAQAATGPSWEGWVAPPRYTGLPTIYLADVSGKTLEVPQGSRVSIRLYGEIGSLSVRETVSADGGVSETEATAFEADITQSGEIEIIGNGGRSIAIAMIADTSPTVTLTDMASTSAEGDMTLPYTAQDDYGVVQGNVVITLDMAALDRRYGLSASPEPRDDITADLPLPITGSRAEFTENFVDDFSKHPWAHMPVTLTATVIDDAEQQGVSAPVTMPLPARRFFDPLAASIIEARRDLLWSRDNGARVAQVLRAVSHEPDGLFRSQTAYLRLRVVIRRLETQLKIGLSPEKRDEIAEALWELALKLEDGDVQSAYERMQQAQERLSQAMRNGASEQEINRLMQELRDATQDYMRQLSREARERGEQPPEGQEGENIQMSQQDLQDMMDRIQELMEQGRMAEAEQALQEYMQMMENMQVTQNQQGQSEGDQAMEGLADTLRDQQGLSDEAFRDLQEQFNPNAQQGQSDQNQGRNGGQGQGESHEGQEGEGEGDNGEGQAGRSLAERQQQLRDELNRQRDGLPGVGGEQGEQAQRNLDQAGRAMDEAAEALRNGDLPEAIDRQAEAMDALREGMRDLSEALAEAQRERQGQQGQADSQPQRQTDPLGRDQGGNGRVDTQDGAVPDEDRRARDLLDEIRRRSGESDRPEVERNYLERLLDRF